MPSGLQSSWATRAMLLGFHTTSGAARRKEYAINRLYISKTKISQFAARPRGFNCPSASKIKSYCDSTDPYCCNGHDANSHQQYVKKYGSQAMGFIKSMVAG
jgi:hypothetical protein